MGFDEQTEELVHEVDLPGAAPDVLRFLHNVLAVDPDDSEVVFVYEIQGQELERLATHFEIEVDATSLDYSVHAFGS